MANSASIEVRISEQSASRVATRQKAAIADTTGCNLVLALATSPYASHPVVTRKARDTGVPTLAMGPDSGSWDPAALVLSQALMGMALTKAGPEAGTYIRQTKQQMHSAGESCPDS